MSIAKEIYQLLEEPIKKDLVLPRCFDEINALLPEFITIHKDNKIIGCAGLKIYSEKIGEIYAMAIAKTHQNQGFSRQLLIKLEVFARQNKIQKLFALSKYQTSWFLKMGFHQTNLSHLPMRRQLSYNLQRKPNIFTKILNEN